MIVVVTVVVKVSEYKSIFSSPCLVTYSIVENVFLVSYIVSTK